MAGIVEEADAVAARLAQFGGEFGDGLQHGALAGVLDHDHVVRREVRTGEGGRDAVDVLVGIVEGADRVEIGFIADQERDAALLCGGEPGDGGRGEERCGGFDETTHAFALRVIG